MSVAPFSFARDEAFDWSLAFLAAGVQLVAVAGIRTTAQRRSLLEQ